MLVHLFLVIVFNVYYVKPGYLSRSGICPHSTTNFIIKDTRLNFYGLSYILPGDETPPCTLSECQYDTDCHGDRKCCSNHCGASVCTSTVREPRPCLYFTCPITKTCKIQKVQCVEPICPDMYTIARPMCINGGPFYEYTKKRSRILRPEIFESIKANDNSWLTSSSPFWNAEESSNASPSTDSWMSFFGRKKK